MTARIVRAVALLLALSVIGIGPPPPRPVDAAGCRLRPSATDMRRVRRMRDARPRLLATAADLDRTRSFSVTTTDAAELRARVQRAADGLIGRSPQSYRRVGPRLQFHDYKARIATLAVAWKLEGDPRYAQQAERELLAAARYRDWNPSHYLDTAEMTAATALGYDWFHSALSRRSRRVIREAIVTKGLRTARCYYRYGNGPTSRTNNWGIVTNAGLAMGAVAVADTHPKLAAAVLGHALRRVRPAMARYGGDGSYPEGLGYWRYATEHAVKLLATLESSFGRQFRVAPEGFARTGDHPLHAVGPLGKVANFGDTRETLGTAPQLFWLARTYGRPVDAWLARTLLGNSTSALHLLWYTPDARDPAAAGVSPARFSPTLNSVFLRSHWNDRTAAYAALKGGANWVTHAHPELGSFVYDARGQRWALDLGLDNYNLPGYFDRRRRHRWYRLSTQGQNTLTVAGMQQPSSAFAPVTHVSTGGTPETVVNLSRAYPAARAVRRGVALVDREALLVQDEVAARKVVSVAWGMHTRAAIRVSVDGQVAELTQGGQRLLATILSPSTGSARFSVVSAAQSPPQARNRGVRKLVIRTQTGPKATRRSLSRLRLAVLLSPGGLRAAPPVAPLARW